MIEKEENLNTLKTKLSFEFILDKINSDTHGNYWTTHLSVARSILAFGTLLNFVFNSPSTLFLISDGYSNTKKNFGKYSIFEIVSDVQVATFISIAILAIVIIGWLPRITCVLHAYIAYSYSTSSVVVEGGDQVATILTILLIPVLLFDTRKNHWNNNNAPYGPISQITSYFSYHLIRLQISIIYLFAAVGKFSSPSWKNGSSIYYWLNDPNFGSSIVSIEWLSFLFQNPVIITITTWGSIILELSISGSIFIDCSNIKRRLRFFYLAVFFHFCIAVFLGLVSFSFIMSAALILYYLWNPQRNYRSHINTKC